MANTNNTHNHIKYKWIKKTLAEDIQIIRINKKQNPISCCVPDTLET